MLWEASVECRRGKSHPSKGARAKQGNLADLIELDQLCSVKIKMSSIVEVASRCSTVCQLSYCVEQDQSADSSELKQPCCHTTKQVPVVGKYQK